MCRKDTIFFCLFQVFFLVYYILTFFILFCYILLTDNILFYPIVLLL